MEVKQCSRCDTVKPLADFYQYKSGPRIGKYHASCKSCKAPAIKAWRKNNPAKQKVIDRSTRLRKLYGIEQEQYDELLEKQGHCCAICDRHKSEFKINLSVDHNHETGEIRGLLCTYCNHRLIGRHKNGDLLRKMAAYVDGGTGWFVPPKPPKKRRRKKKT